MVEVKFKHAMGLGKSVSYPRSADPRISGMIGFKFKHLKELGKC